MGALALPKNTVLLWAAEFSLQISRRQPEQTQARGPSTVEERAKVIELTRSLEREPLSENAGATRQWLQ
jgi:hypothetical protein